jgi:reactive chlorine resistance protein C
MGVAILRYALVLILIYFGAFKFTRTEARAIQPLLEHSPLMFWLYSIFDVDGVSRLIGLIELTIAGLILTRPWSRSLSAIGSLAAVGMFLTTLSFLLLGAAVFTAGEALQDGNSQ